MNRYKMVLRILAVFVVILIALPICAIMFHGCEKRVVHYHGWDTRIMPTVYFRSVSNKYAYIILYKRVGFFKEKEKIINLEKPENLKLFSKFLAEGTYDGLSNYIGENTPIIEKEE